MEFRKVVSHSDLVRCADCGAEKAALAAKILRSGSSSASAMCIDAITSHSALQPALSAPHYIICSEGDDFASCGVSSISNMVSTWSQDSSTAVSSTRSSLDAMRAESLSFDSCRSRFDLPDGNPFARHPQDPTTGFPSRSQPLPQTSWEECLRLTAVVSSHSGMRPTSAFCSQAPEPTHSRHPAPPSPSLWTRSTSDHLPLTDTSALHAAAVALSMPDGSAAGNEWGAWRSFNRSCSSCSYSHENSLVDTADIVGLSLLSTSSQDPHGAAGATILATAIGVPTVPPRVPPHPEPATPWSPACPNSASRAITRVVALDARTDFRRTHSESFMLQPDSSRSHHWHHDGGSGGGRDSGPSCDDSDSDSEELTRAITRGTRAGSMGTQRRSWSNQRLAFLGITDRASSTPGGPPPPPLVPSSNRLSLDTTALSAASPDSPPPAGDSLRSRTNYHLTDRHAAMELFLRVNHARQTLDFAKRQAAAFAHLDKGQYDVWEALALLNELPEYEAALLGCEDATPDMTPLDHAYQTAELCRLAHPDLDWLHLVGLIHGLGKVLVHRRWGSNPQWSVCGETFPVGCRFSSLVEGAEYFIANPDRRRRRLNTRCGMYREQCGLSNVYLSWGAAEYLFLVLALNDTSLPPEALFIVRHHKFWTLAAEGGHAYGHLMSPDDVEMLPLLADFQAHARYRDRGPLEGGLQGEERRAYYDGLMAKYLGTAKLAW